jgi:hypothetical protein
MRRAVISLLVGVLGLTGGCAYSVQGTPIAEQVFDGESPFPTETTAPPTTSGTKSSTPPASGQPDAGQIGDICAFVGWKDLPYQVSDPSAKPTDKGYDQTFEQSCKWQTKVEKLDVGVTLRFRVGKALTLQQSTGEYDVNGRKITYFDRTDDPEVQPSCVLVMDYAGGGLGIIVIDGTAKFGAICDQGKHVAELMLAKEPKQ